MPTELSPGDTIRKIAVAVMFAAVAFGFYWNYTLAIVDFVSAATLNAKGVTTRRLGPLPALSVDRCLTGKPCRCVALVHGLGDIPHTWGKTLLAAPSGFRVVAPYMPGTPPAKRPARKALWRIPAQAGTLKAALRTETDCSRWTLAGNSLGGWTASWLALRWPEGVGKLVLLNSAGLKDPTGASQESAEVLAKPSVEAMKRFSARAYHTERVVPERVWNDIVARIASRGTYEIAAAIEDDDFLDGRLGALRPPLTIIWGESDRVIPPTQAARFAKAVPGAKTILEKNCGHIPQKECPDSFWREIYE